MSTGRHENIVSVIKYFIDTKRYGPVDRMALAMGPESIEIALYDMLRTINSLYGRSVLIKIRPEKTKADKNSNTEFIVRCCEYDEDKKLGYGIYGEVLDALEGGSDLVNKKIQCMPCPHLPKREEITDFLEKIREDPSYARRLVIEAFSLQERKEGE